MSTISRNDVSSRWCLSIWSFNYKATAFSINLDTNVRFEIGWKFCNCSKSASCLLRTGNRFNTATFKAYGITPFLRDMFIIEVNIGRMMGKHVFRTDAGSGSRSRDFVNVFTANFFTISKVTCWKLWICTSHSLSVVWDELRSFSRTLSVNALRILSILLMKKLLNASARLVESGKQEGYCCAFCFWSNLLRATACKYGPNNGTSRKIDFTPILPIDWP